MTRAALTKLFVLVVLAFIICLPEFFSSNRVSKVNFHCAPYRHCKRGIQTRRGGNGKIEDAEIKRSKEECDPEREKWEAACTQRNSRNNATDGAPHSRRVAGDFQEGWFMCQTDMDMAALHRNMSRSAATVLKVHLEVSVELQLSEAQTVNLTLYGHSNNNTLDLHPPEEPRKEEEEEEAGEGLQASCCCLSGPSTSESDNHSRCLLWLANRTLSSATASERKPQRKRTQKGEWQCVVRGLWLALLCVVLLTVLTIVLRQIYLWMMQPRRTTHNFGNVTVQQLNGGDKHTEIRSHKVLHFSSSQPCSELSPIEEAHSPEESETLLAGNVNANLHLYGHPTSTSNTEEQQEEKHEHK